MKGIAAVTAFAFAVTTFLPAGWAQPTRETQTLRIGQPESDESKVKTGLEEALQAEVEQPAEVPTSVSPSTALKSFWEKRGVAPPAVSKSAPITAPQTTTPLVEPPSISSAVTAPPEMELATALVEVPPLLEIVLPSLDQANELGKLLGEVAKTTDATYLNAVAKALSMEVATDQLEGLRAGVIEALAQRYQFAERDMVRMPEGMEVKNRLREMLGLPQIVSEQRWRSRGYTVIKAMAGNRAVKAIVIARGTKGAPTVGWTDQAMRRAEQLRRKGTDVTFLALGSHPEFLVRESAGKFSSQILDYLKLTVPPTAVPHTFGYLTVVTPVGDLDTLEVEDTDDPLVAWVKHRLGGQAAVEVSLSLGSQGYLRQVHLANLELALPIPLAQTVLANSEIQTLLAQRREMDIEMAEAVAEEKQIKRSMAQIAAALVGLAVVTGLPHVANAQSPFDASPQAGPTLSPGSSTSVQMQLPAPLPPKLVINASQLPFREHSGLSAVPPQREPGVVAKIGIKLPVQPEAPLEVTAVQTTSPRVLASPSHFARNPRHTAKERATHFLASIRSWIRQRVYGTEHGTTWTAAYDPAKALFLSNSQVGYTVWSPEKLHLMGEDAKEALFQSIGEGAKAQGTQAVLLYETNWSVTLAGAQGEKNPVPEAVLQKLQSDIARAHRHGLKIWPVYSGVEGLGDPDVAVRHLNIAMDQGFDREVIVTNIEPWAVPEDQPEGVWARAIKRMQQAEARGDQQGISRARQELLQAAFNWVRVHEDGQKGILRQVISPDQAHPETIQAPAQVYAFIKPAAVPVVRMAILWHQLEKAAKEKGYNVQKVWLVFDKVAMGLKAGEQLDVDKLAQAIKKEGFDPEFSKIQVRLPDRMKLIVMAYAYPEATDQKIAQAVAQQMRMAYAQGFGGQMGLAVNLEPPLLAKPTTSLANRSEKAGAIVTGIVQELIKPNPLTGPTGFDGKTIFVHAADGLSLMDMAKGGKLSSARIATPKRTESVLQVIWAAAMRAFGVTPRTERQQHRIPKEQTVVEWADWQAVNTLWGLGGGVVGIGPWYAAFENLETWIVKNQSVIHPDSGPGGPEFGIGERTTSLLMGALGSGKARVTNMSLHLIKRDANGRIVRERTFQHISGKNSPVISDDIWDEAEYEVTVRRVGSRWGPRLVVDMAAKVENRYAPGETPRESWSRAAIWPGQTEATFTVKLPRLVAGTNAIILLTHDNQGQIVEWVGPGQNPLHLTPYAPFIAESADSRLKQAQQDLANLANHLGKKPGERLTPQELENAGRQDLILDQQALEINALSVMTGAKAEVLVPYNLSEGLDLKEVAHLLETLKSRGMTYVTLHVPDLLQDADKALSGSDQGLDPSDRGYFQGRYFSQLKGLIKKAHRYGLKAYLVVDTEELFDTAKPFDDKSLKEKGKPRYATADILRLIMEANEHEKWIMDGIAFYQAAPNPEHRAAIERILREGLGVSTVFVGPQGITSQQSLYARQVELKGKPEEVLKQVRETLDRPQTARSRGHRFPTAVYLEGKSLGEITKWLDRLPTVGSSEEVKSEFLTRLRVPDKATDEVLSKASTVSQEELMKALQPEGRSGEPGVWAKAFVEARAEELRATAEISQVERYGTPYDNVVLSLYGIRVSPLILTEAQRAEVIPLLPKHLYQTDGTAWLGVQVTNPANPEVAKAPATYDLWVDLDYPSWTNRPKAVHRAQYMVLKPGETAPAWVKLEGLPVGEDSLVARVRAIPRSAEEYRPGQKATRSDEEQALELVSFTIHGSDKKIESERALREEKADFKRWEENWRQARGIKPGHFYAALYEKLLKQYFGVGTRVQRFEVIIQRDPLTGRMDSFDLHPYPTDPVATGVAEAKKVRDALAKWKTDPLARVQGEPERLGLRLMSWFYTVAARVGLVGAAFAFLVGMLKGYRRAGAARRYREEMKRNAVHLQLGDGANLPAEGPPNPGDELTQEFDVRTEEVIRVSITKPGAPFESLPVHQHREHNKVVQALSAFGKNRIGVLSSTVEQESQNIQRTPVGSLGRRDPGKPAALIWNHPIFLTALGIATLAGAYALAAAFSVPLLPAALFAAAWWGGVVFLAQPEWGRLLGAFGITALGTAILLGLLGATLPVWIWLVLSAATVLITQRILISWLQEERPVEGLLREGWSALRFTVKWSFVAAAVYGLFAVVHPWLWAGTKLPLLGMGGLGLKALLTLPLLGTQVTVGLLIVGAVLLLNLVWQGYLLTNWLQSRAAPRRDWWSFTLLGLGVPVLILGSFWIWGAAPAAAVLVYIWAWAAIAQGTALLLMGRHLLSTQIRHFFERADGIERLAPDERVLVNEYGRDPTQEELQTWVEAWRDAANDTDQQYRQGITGFPSPISPPPGGLTAQWVTGELKRLKPEHRRLINLNYWKLRSIQKAQAHPNFNELSTEHQELLFRRYFNEFLLAHLDTVISGDLGGTLLRTFGYGWWTGTMGEPIRRMRNDDRLVVAMPALILSIGWVPGDMPGAFPWPRIKEGQWWLIAWEIFRMLLASFTAPLGFAVSMVNRMFRSALIKDTNMLNLIRARADAGLGGYREPVNYVIDVMGRWLVGHAYVVREAYSGKRVTRSAANLLRSHRLERKDGSVRAHIERLRKEAEEAWAQPQRDQAGYQRLMAAAHYAALTGGKNVNFELGETPPPGPPQEDVFTRAQGRPGADPLTDDTRMPPELHSGALASTVGQRLSDPQFHFPMRLESVLRHRAEDGMIVDLLPLLEVVGKKDGKDVLGKVARIQVADQLFRLVLLSEEEQRFLKMGDVEASKKVTLLPNGKRVYYGTHRDSPDSSPYDTVFVNDKPILRKDFERVRQLAPEPGRVNFKVGRFVKARGADTGFQILQGRFSPEEKIGPIKEPKKGRPTHEVKIGIRSEEDAAFPELRLVRETVDDPRDRYKGIRRAEGVKAADSTAKRRHQRMLRKRFQERFHRDPNEQELKALDITELFQGELGYDAYKDPKGLWYQLRLNFFGRLRDRYLGLDAKGNSTAWRAGLWWLGTLALGAVIAWVSGSVTLGAGIVVGPWLITILFGILVPVSFIGLGIQDTILQGMKAHYDGAFLKEAMDGFFRDTPARERGILKANGYGDLLGRGLEIISSDSDLQRLVELYPHLMHPEHRFYKLFPFQQADPAIVKEVEDALGVKQAPKNRWALRRRAKKEIISRVEKQLKEPKEKGGDWLAFREAFTRNTQLELAAVGNEAAGISYHRSRNPDVFRGGEMNQQFAVEVQAPLASLMKELKIPPVAVRSWALASKGTFYGAVRIPSMMMDADKNRIAPLEAYLKQGGGQTVNEFMLSHTYLQPDLEAVQDFLREESQELARGIPDQLTVDQVNTYLGERERRLGFPEGSTFVRLKASDQGWLNQQLKNLKESIKQDGQIRLSAAKPLPERYSRLLMRVRWWAVAGGILLGIFQPSLLAVALVAWILGLSPVRTGLTSLSRWVQPQVWRKALHSWKEPYSDEVILLSLLYGVKKGQIVKDKGGRIVDLKWSALDGLYDASRWRLAIGPYLFPGSPIARLPLWERGGAMIHAPPVPFLAALRLLEEPPWLAPASGFNRLPTDAFEIGIAFAEDTYFGLLNLHRPTLNPTVNALNIHKLNYLFSQQEVRKDDQVFTRALQFFKGVGMAEAVKHLFGHPMFARYRTDQETSKAAETIHKIFGWDPVGNRPSDQSIFGMEAFRRDEVAAAGARGAGTLSYGYSGFTASDLFGRRVGPFAPGDVAAYWEYRKYEQLDQVWGGRRVRKREIQRVFPLMRDLQVPGEKVEYGLFFKTLRAIQRRRQQGLVAGTTPEAFLQGPLVDPWAVLAEAGTRIWEGLIRVRANELWRQSGYTHGPTLEHWEALEAWIVKQEGHLRRGPWGQEHRAEAIRQALTELDQQLPLPARPPAAPATRPEGAAQARKDTDQRGLWSEEGPATTPQGRAPAPGEVETGEEGPRSEQPSPAPEPAAEQTLEQMVEEVSQTHPLPWSDLTWDTIKVVIREDPQSIVTEFPAEFAQQLESIPGMSQVLDRIRRLPPKGGSDATQAGLEEASVGEAKQAMPVATMPATWSFSPVTATAVGQGVPTVTAVLHESSFFTRTTAVPGMIQFFVDTREDPRTLRLAQLAAVIKAREGWDIEFAGVARESELEAAVEELKGDIGSQVILEDRVTTYEQDTGYEAARNEALARLPAGVEVITRIDQETLAWFDRAIQAAGLRYITEELKQRVEALLKAA